LRQPDADLREQGPRFFASVMLGVTPGHARERKV
jgi:hypothetical protein